MLTQFHIFNICGRINKSNVTGRLSVYIQVRDSNYIEMCPKVTLLDVATSLPTG